MTSEALSPKPGIVALRYGSVITLLIKVSFENSISCAETSPWLSKVCKAKNRKSLCVMNYVAFCLMVFGLILRIASWAVFLAYTLFQSEPGWETWSIPYNISGVCWVSSHSWQNVVWCVPRFLALTHRLDGYDVGEVLKPICPSYNFISVVL